MSNLLVDLLPKVKSPFQCCEGPPQILESKGSPIEKLVYTGATPSKRLRCLLTSSIESGWEDTGSLPY